LHLVAGAQPAATPSRTIEIVVAYGAGGSTDLVARALAQRFQERLGQSVVVLNRPGASGALGAGVAAHASPDGYTLLVGFTTELAVVPQVSKATKYSLDDFEPIAVSGIVPVVLISAKTMRPNTLAELIEELRRSPGKYTFGGSLGSPSHIMGAWLNRLNTYHTTFPIAAARRRSPTWWAATSICSTPGLHRRKPRSTPVSSRLTL
jgi:tripartite-type tricarboxylate transporter receptor subunit TctC